MDEQIHAVVQSNNSHAYVLFHRQMANDLVVFLFHSSGILCEINLFVISLWDAFKEEFLNYQKAPFLAQNYKTFA